MTSAPHHAVAVVTVHHGDALAVLAEMAAESVTVAAQLHLSRFADIATP